MAVFAVNRKAAFDYEILETYEAGISLTGLEVKSVRAGRMNLVGAFVLVRGGEAWLLNAAVPPYQPKNAPAGYDPAGPRKLLLHRAELRELIGKSAAKGLTLLPVRVYTKGPRIKLEIGLARRKRKYDKREAIRRRDMEREAARAIE
ncbi:MAG: SsrA-binding protein [Candidatus Sungbacteria bacterium RIFCSPLOWO2_01_FULL_59_16]|uniref:SsrA-binding protein n=1 Tax=Candidatus Sungbacteria bacterium RIFCSPLOWO2_01_FULL_59_16 TaxID=1802280 RepID=A0A1G2LE47_9BACT|nr:MAG: SsrA-binding protein [Candidatus Sungbacteria bacterium RIFCSPLOWO2_01_FULL_59_16]